MEEAGTEVGTRFDTAREFIDYLRLSHEHWDRVGEGSSRWIFRGHANAAWDLLPQAWRACRSNRLYPVIEHLRKTEGVEDDIIPGISNLGPNYHHACCWIAAECMALNEFRKCAWSIGFEVEQPEDALDPKNWLWLIPSYNKYSPSILAGNDIGLAQHYGVPTRFLDWTYNPLIAAFFAVHPSVDLQEKDIQDIAVWAVSIDYLKSATFKDDTDVFHSIVCHIPRRCGNDFIRAQEGLLIEIPPLPALKYFLDNERWPTVDQWVADNSKNVCGTKAKKSIEKYTLPASEVRNLYNLLSCEGLRHERLMPTLENAAKASLKDVLSFADTRVPRRSFYEGDEG